MFASLLARVRALVARVPAPIRELGEPIVGPVLAAIRTAWHLLRGNVEAVLDEPIVVFSTVLAAVNDVALHSSLKVYVVAAATAVLRLFVHTEQHAPTDGSSRLGDALSSINGNG